MLQIRCQDLSVGYGNNEVIKNLSFNINKGDYICILGPNGTGKSTLMKTILNLKRPISGDIRLEKGVSRCEFGYLTQQKDVQSDFPALVEEIVISGCQSRCGPRLFYSKKEKIIAKKSMKKLNILVLKNKRFNQLSGGQRQRVLIARSLCASRKILFLDEPIAGLDASATKELYEIIGNLNRLKQLTIVMISHDIQKSLQYATHILYLGKDTFFGTKEEYLNKKTQLTSMARGEI